MAKINKLFNGRKNAINNAVDGYILGPKKRD